MRRRSQIRDRSITEIPRIGQRVALGIADIGCECDLVRGDVRTLFARVQHDAGAGRGGIDRARCAVRDRQIDGGHIRVHTVPDRVGNRYGDAFPERQPGELEIPVAELDRAVCRNPEQAATIGPQFQPSLIVKTTTGVRQAIGLEPVDLQQIEGSSAVIVENVQSQRRPLTAADRCQVKRNRVVDRIQHIGWCIGDVDRDSGNVRPDTFGILHPVGETISALKVRIESDVFGMAIMARHQPAIQQLL